RSDRVVRERARIQDDPGESPALGVLEPVDQLPLRVGLAAFDSETAAPRVAADRAVDFGQRGPAVDARLTRAEKVEIRPVEDENGPCLCGHNVPGYTGALCAATNLASRRRRE